MTDFNAKARELMMGAQYQDAQLKFIQIAAALKAAWNDALDEAAAMVRPSALYGVEFAKKLRAKKVTL